MNVYAFLPFAAFLSNSFLLFYGLSRNTNTDLHRNYLKFMLCISLWSLLDFINWNWEGLNEDWVMFIYRIQAPTYIFLGIYFLRFCYSLLNKRKDFMYKHFIWVSLTVALLGVFTGEMTSDYKEVWWGIMHIPGEMFIPCVFISTVIPCQYAVYLLFRGIKTATSQSQKKQIILVFTGSLLTVNISFFTDILIPHFIGLEDAIQLAGASAAFMAIFMHRAVTKYDLLPINIKDTIEELFEYSRQGVLIINSEKKIVEMNPTAEVLLDTNEETLIGMPIKDIIKDDIFTEGKDECEVIQNSRDGECYLHISSTSHIRKNELIGWVLIIRNVSTERLAHKKIKDLNQNLEERVKQRTNELEESKQKLLDKTEDLERVSRYKSEFMANMSHEIRTPMNGIMGFTEILLLEQGLSESENESLQNIKKCSNQLLDLVNDILDFSKIEADCIALEKIHLDLGLLLLESAEICRSKLDISHKNVEVLLDVSSINHLVLGDPTRLKQVIINLVNNAIKFTESGHVLLKAEKMSESNDSLSVKFSVTDTGIGISEEQRERIFNAFEQADGSTTRKYGGTGLGLTICKKLIELMGGQLEVKSIQNEGSEFYFTIEMSKGEILNIPNLEGSNLNVLNIDDSETSAKVLERSLNIKGGYKSLTGKEFFQSFEVPTHIFVNLDNFSKLDRENLNKKLDSFSFKPRIIALSSSKNQQSINNAKLINAEKHLSKPYYFINLINYLNGNKPQRTSDKTTIDFGKSYKILMVEDNPVNQKLQMNLLNRMGHDVTLAQDGEEAVQFGQDPSYELIFMDMQLPQMSGLEATEKLRNIGIKTPIIALTANAFESDKSNCLKAGMNDFISKPVNIRTFQNVLTKHLTY